MGAIQSVAAVGLVLLPLLVWFGIVSWYLLRAPHAVGGPRSDRPLWAEALHWSALLVVLWAVTVGLFLLARLIDPSLTLFGPIDMP